MMLANRPAMYAAVEGSTDSEVLFYVAFAFGLEDDPVHAIERTIGLAEEAQRAHGIEPEIQASIGVSNGRSLWAIRYASQGTPRTLFALRRRRRRSTSSTRTTCACGKMREGDHLIVSEPLADLPGAWHEIPASTALTVAEDGTYDSRPFEPVAP